MEQEQILENTKEYVKNACMGETSGHDWWHIERVYQNAQKINETEQADSFLVGMIAYLHDLYDHKFFSGDPRKKLEETILLLDPNEKLSKEQKENIIHSCLNLGYANNILQKQELSIEGKIVQDADRLDALGAIAIARTFTYSGAKGRPMYLPEEKEQEVIPEEYQKNGSKSSIGHFYDKVLKVKEKMNTDTAKKLAEERHHFVEIYLQEFLDEWYGRK